MHLIYKLTLHPPIHPSTYQSTHESFHVTSFPSVLLVAMQVNRRSARIPSSLMHLLLIPSRRRYHYLPLPDKFHYLPKTGGKDRCDRCPITSQLLDKDTVLILEHNWVWLSSSLLAIWCIMCLRRGLGRWEEGAHVRKVSQVYRYTGVVRGGRDLAV